MSLPVWKGTLDKSYSKMPKPKRSESIKIGVSPEICNIKIDCNPQLNEEEKHDNTEGGNMKNNETGALT